MEKEQFPLSFQKIHKQLNRIKRVAASLSKKNQNISSELDEIILSSLKIEKLLNECTFSIKNKCQKYSYDSFIHSSMKVPVLEGGDQYYRDAILSIERCMEKFGRFEKKINIMISQSKMGGKIAKSKSVNAFRKYAYHDYNLEVKPEKKLSVKQQRGNENAKNEQNQCDDSQYRCKNTIKQQKAEYNNNTQNKSQKNSLKSSQRLKISSKKDVQDAEQLNKLKKLDKQIKYLIKQIKKQKNWSFSHISENQQKEIAGYQGEDYYHNGVKKHNKL